ncbi:MAG: helix-turn-helix domain-containing protein [Armatimonadetes bacterium]|nr:helix-turn-helix domain-containing protein [Armatimonadota bacterium]
MGKRVSKTAKRAFARRLRAWRQGRQMSQSEAAGRLGVPVRTLQNWEIARTKPSRLLEQMLLRAMA